MTARALCTPGQAEPLKLGVHGAFAALAGLCCAYNLAAFLYRHETRLAVNTVLYTAIASLEVYQVKRHWEHVC